jgi:BirA family biotin operon repressor/biotin-[acetyl-CoA-carboxylase] ligase
MEVVRGLGVEDVRLRWPNDIMVGRRKLAGLLVERFHNDRVVLGIGMNVQNRPEKLDPALANIPTTLADHVSEVPKMNELIHALLSEITKLQKLIVAGDFGKICDDLNRSWRCREVELSLRGKSNKERVFFEGVNEKGDLLVRSENQQQMSYSAVEVELLRELYKTASR